MCAHSQPPARRGSRSRPTDRSFCRSASTGCRLPQPIRFPPSRPPVSLTPASRFRISSSAISSRVARARAEPDAAVGRPRARQHAACRYGDVAGGDVDARSVRVLRFARADDCRDARCARAGLPEGGEARFRARGHVFVGYCRASPFGELWNPPAIAFDLNNLAALTALRLTAPPVRLAFSFGAGSGLTAWLVVMAVLIGATAFVGPVPIIAPFLIAGAALVGILPHVVLAMIGRVLFNHIDQVLAPLRLLQSPAAVPPGVFEAFGDLVPTTLVLDDLYVAGVLRTPTAPWTVLPLSNRGKPPRPAPGDRPRPPPGPTPVPPTAPGTIPVAPHGTTTGTRP